MLRIVRSLQLAAAAMSTVLRDLLAIISLIMLCCEAASLGAMARTCTVAAALRFAPYDLMLQQPWRDGRTSKLQRASADVTYSTAQRSRLSTSDACMGTCGLQVDLARDLSICVYLF
jgi:hypothetical protein